MLNRLFSSRVQPPTVPPGARVYAIGDIHGRADLFERLLALIETDSRARGPERPLIVLLGDLIDRGPASREVVRRAMQGFPWASSVAIMGNHEEVAMEILDGDLARLSTWMRIGGLETLLSWGVAPETIEEGSREDIQQAFSEAVTRDERLWMARMQPCVQIGDYYFVHAGVRPGVPLDRQTKHDGRWIRDEFLESRRHHGAMVVHGHTISSEIEDLPNRIGIDTGAYATGTLTAIGVEGADHWFLQT